MKTESFEVDDFYPGSKRKRKAILTPPVEPPEAVVWDSRPTKRTLPSGEDIDMFSIGALALALNRPIITVRTWIKEGNLPSSPYRLSSTVDVNGKDHKGKRLYSRAMIEAAVTLFTTHGLLESRRIDWSVHRLLTTEIVEAWSNIRATEMNPTN